jgi:hypothetical protein
MQVSARFFLQEVKRIPYHTTNNQGNNEATNVTLAPVQGEPFGPATPQGTIQMLIVNADAAQVFLNTPINQQFDILISPVEEEAQQ